MVGRSVLVTGASGRLGRRVTALLHDLGHSVRATDRVGTESITGTFVLADLREPEAVHRLVAGVKTVVHLGNHAGIGPQLPEVVFNENVAMNANVFQAAATQGVTQIVFASTIQLLGSHTDPRTVVNQPPRPQLPIDHESEPTPTNLYSLSKTVAEQMLRYYAQRCGLDVSVVRFPLLHTPDDPVAVSTGKESATDLIEAFGGLTYDDAAAAISALVERRVPGFRTYVAAFAHRHGDLDADGVRAHFFPHVEPGTALFDLSALERDTDWKPRGSYGPVTRLGTSTGDQP